MMLSRLDQMIAHFDDALRAISGSVGTTHRPSPGNDVADNEMDAAERQKAARLMRVNHCGEVCAQALYNGQAMTAKTSRVAGSLLHAADEETDHLAWCEKRIAELDGHVSYLNPLWYAGSFAMGAVTGLLGDKINLGFVAAIEEEVCQHIDDHLERLPPQDDKSRQILVQMREDEKNHAGSALEQGGIRFPSPVKRAMRSVSRLMTRTSYWV